MVPAKDHQDLWRLSLRTTWWAHPPTIVDLLRIHDHICQCQRPEWRRCPTWSFSPWGQHSAKPSPSISIETRHEVPLLGHTAGTQESGRNLRTAPYIRSQVLEHFEFLIRHQLNVFQRIDRLEIRGPRRNVTSIEFAIQRTLFHRTAQTHSWQ